MSAKHLYVIRVQTIFGERFVSRLCGAMPSITHNLGDAMVFDELVIEAYEREVVEQFDGNVVVMDVKRAKLVVRDPLSILMT